MAALPYMQLYVADYLADTMHLTTEEHGAYLLLIFNYWQTGKPLPDDDQRLAIISRLSNERWTDVKQTLIEFFVLVEDKLVHPRIEADLQFVEDKQNKAIAAGKASAVARAKKRDKKLNVRSSSVKTSVIDSLQLESNQKEVEEDTDIKKDFPSDSDEIRLSELLFNLIIRRNPNHKKPNFKTWAKQIDLMIRVDNRQPQDIANVIGWCQEDDFWKNNILSTEKLRKQFDTLVLKRNEDKQGSEQIDQKGYLDKMAPTDRELIEDYNQIMDNNETVAEKYLKDGEDFLSLKTRIIGCRVKILKKYEVK